MKNAVLRDVTPCASCKNRRLGETSVLTRATRRNIPEDGILDVRYCYLYERIPGDGILWTFIAVSRRLERAMVGRNVKIEGKCTNV
jgi:hypothetical protein